jgi:hypothetical protein
MGDRMGFRRHKSDIHRRSKAWHEWIDQHRSELREIGLPAAVYLDEARWHDFLENGYLEWHDNPPGFEFGKLGREQLRALHRFLEREYGQLQRPPPLLEWVRVRCREEG